MNLQKVIKSHEFVLFILVIAFFVIGGFINPNLTSIGTIFNVTQSSIPLGLFALGVFLVMLSGGIDVSCTGIAIFSVYGTTKLLMYAGFLDNIPMAILIAALMGLVLGAFNAIFTAYFNISALIVTLGTLSVFQGALLAFVSTGIFNTVPKSMSRLQGIDLVTAKSGRLTYGLPIFVLLLVGAALITWLMLRYTRIGQGIYAIGGDVESAKRIGFNPMRLKFFIYPYAGFLYGLAGLVRGSITRRVNPIRYVGDELIVIAAVILGGTRITGGHGSVIGVLLGVFLYNSITENLVLLGIPSTWQKATTGILILGSVAFTTFQRKSEQRG